ncbi:MAG TPA: hypothetical protein PK530_25110, partial [Anaerolineales bacterium]|nr:hypothetical protein [Anaerolineales bacterium]
MSNSKKILLFLLLVTFSACSSPNVETPLANSTPVPITSTPTRVVPTETGVPPPTEIPPTETPDPALLHANWMGGITHPDGTTEAILVRLDDGSLTIQPQADALSLEGVSRVGNTLAFQVIGAREMTFSGQWDGAQISGEVNENGAASPFVLRPMAEVGTLQDYAGTYQFENGDALTVQISPTFRASGLDFFWEGLTVTDFGTGAIRGLYPVEADRFLVGSGRVLGFPFGAEIRFLREGGNVTGLIWTNEAGERQAARLDLPAETV